MHNPRVSIIIPVYNAENYINDTLVSCINQSYKNVEIIVVNDGSTDNSEKRILSFQDSRIKYFSIKNSGAAEARNLGILKSSGSLVQFLDADDIIDIRKIELQIVQYEKYGDDFIYSSIMGGIVNDKKYLEVNFNLYYKNFKPIAYFQTLLNQFGKYLTTGSWLVPMKIISRIKGWDKNAGLNDDGEYFSRAILNSFGIIHCPAAIFYYRRDVINSFSKRLDSRDVYMKWYYSYCCYADNFVLHFDKKTACDLGRKALSVYYCSSYPNYPEISLDCLKKIKSLGFNKPFVHGGKSLKILSFLFGLNTALKINYLRFSWRF